MMILPVQTVHGIPVYTDWSYETILACFQNEYPVSYILTNSRSFTAAQTEVVHRDIAIRIAEAAAQTNQEYVLVSRGDSTLRGHWPLETQTLAETLCSTEGKRLDGEVILPAFMEGRRFTFGNIHYLKDGEWLIPAGQSEFANDVTFGYQSSALADWCAEKSKGLYPADQCICIALEDIRALNIEKITSQLIEAKNFAKIIVDAVCYQDLKVFFCAYAKAVQTGKRLLFRTAASWVKILGGILDRPLLSHEELVSDTMLGGIVLIGSYVQKTTRQLEMMENSNLPLRYMEFQVACVQDPKDLAAEVERIVSEAETWIRAGISVVIYTSRTRLDSAGASGEARLQTSVAISEAVTGIIGKLRVRPSFILAKGGITSSDVGVKALRVKRAQVMGQISPGIPVWMTGEESKYPHMPYVIFPGNVGEETTLRDVAEILMGSRSTRL